MLLYSGKDICSLMRTHKLTIVQVAQRLGVTQGRVRFVRTHGLRDPHYLRDWVQAITGRDPGPV